jgi:hypothetical protein
VAVRPDHGRPLSDRGTYRRSSPCRAARPAPSTHRPHSPNCAQPGISRVRTWDGSTPWHSWLAESAVVDLSFTAVAAGRTAGIGDRLAVDTGTPVTATVVVNGVAGATVSVLDQLGVEHSQTVPASGRATVSWTTYPRYSRWVRVEVRRPSGGINTTVTNAMVAMTNPVFLGNP